MNEELNGREIAAQQAAKIRGEVEAKNQAEEEKKESALVELESLRSMANVGMSHVDKTDIRPPQILLVQKSSNLDEMVDIEGNKPSFGQFFNTGSRQIFDSFDCYVIFAKKGTWIDRRKPENGPQEQYSMIGVMKETNRIFGMLLRASARFSLNNLFSTAIDQHYPMFAFNIHVETKQLENKDGKWVVPVFRIGQLETDSERLSFLIKTAKQFDSQAGSINLEDDAEVSREVRADSEISHVEDVSDDMPF